MSPKKQFKEVLDNGLDLFRKILLRKYFHSQLIQLKNRFLHYGFQTYDQLWEKNCKNFSKFFPRCFQIARKNFWNLTAVFSFVHLLLNKTLDQQHPIFA